jgi:electron transfer flavoprotein alpha subunit
MLVRGVINYQIDQNTDSALFGAVGKLDEIAERTVARIDVVIVSDVVTIVPARRSLKRHQPNRGHAESMQIIEAAHQSLEIARPIAVSVHVSTDRQTVDHGVLVPKIVNHMRL